jgi:hypothetical protein
MGSVMQTDFSAMIVVKATGAFVLIMAKATAQENRGEVSDAFRMGPRRKIDFLSWPAMVISLCSRSVAMASIFVGAIALSLRLLLTPLLPLPKPAVHDEFSYLLAADTFSHGRLTNPAHPMWIHFETFHELFHPTYASMYPPGQGLVLALGQIFHAPWSALWIGMAVLCGLITWALWVWLEPPWAIAAGLLAALQLTGSYWTESYWGGTVAAIGGALVVGALARLLRRASAGPALAFGLGLAILANTRPYEGLVLGASSAVFLLVHLILSLRRGRQNFSQLVHSIGLPLAAVLLPTFIWMGYYNYRVTGDPLQMPYSLADKQYGSWSPFLWSNHPRPEPKFNHESFRAFLLQFETPENQFDRLHILLQHRLNLIDFYRFFLGWPLLLCILISLPRLVRIRRLRVPLLLLLLFYLGLSVEANLYVHYFAPATVLVFLIASAAVHDVSSRFSPRKIRLAAACALFFCIGMSDVCRVMDPASRAFSHIDLPWLAAQRNLGMVSTNSGWSPTAGAPSIRIQEAPFIEQRDQVLAFLQKQPGQLLVLVRYGPHHIVHNEWVYNDANIDQSRIVWAHAMPGGKNDELLRYYPDRRVWILDDDGGVTLRPMDSGSAQAVEP